MTNLLHPVRRGTVRLLPGLFLERYQLNRSYMLSLKTENLLQNHYLEAGLWSPAHRLEEIHWGWEAPSCQLRGHFLGHWLSAAASIGAATGDQEVKGKADYIVSELARCQQENGGEWAGSIPEKYLDWVARGKPV
ncbi:MAG: beta-L-arabinofuranosidase domain-containing protein, partial [Caldilinea sp.]